MELDGGDIGIFFVNNTEEVLERVTAGTGGCQTIDDEITSFGGSSPQYSYEIVMPDEAIQVESYHIIFDSDYLLQLNIEVQSAIVITLT